MITRASKSVASTVADYDDTDLDDQLDVDTDLDPDLDDDPELEPDLDLDFEPELVFEPCANFDPPVPGAKYSTESKFNSGRKFGTASKPGQGLKSGSGARPGHQSHGHLRYRIPQMRIYLVQDGPKPDEFPIRTPSDVAKLISPLKNAAEEHFVSLHLNAHHEVIGLHEVSHGTLSSSLVHPREVFKAALLANSYAIIVAHNHPSGSRLSASPEDLNTTEQLVQAAKLMGVCLLDHLIINRNDEVFSIRENHPQFWETDEKSK